MHNKCRIKSTKETIIHTFMSPRQQQFVAILIGCSRRISLVKLLGQRYIESCYMALHDSVDSNELKEKSTY